MTPTGAGEDRDEPPPDLALLSPREREVLDAAVEGLSAREMAQRLSLSEATIRSHLSTIYSKLGVAGRIGLLARLNGTVATKAVPSAEPGNPPPRSAPARPGRGALSGVAALALLVVAAGAFLVTRPHLPPRADLATVSQLLAAHDVTLLDLRGETLTVTKRSGEHLSVDGVTQDRFQPLEALAVGSSVATSLSSEPRSFPTEMAIVVTTVLPLMFIGVAVLVVVRTVRRPPRIRPVG
jgi:DNA-binding CsgD family transcriptional regulator